jgi:hypothetical protein
MYAKIKPVNTFKATATTFFIGNVTVQLGASASLQWWLHQENGDPVYTGTLELLGAEYNEWDDDAALYTVVAAKVGVTVLEVLPGGIPVLDTRTPEMPPVESPENPT